jgi:hypothetical protein
LYTSLHPKRVELLGTCVEYTAIKRTSHYKPELNLLGTSDAYIGS